MQQPWYCTREQVKSALDVQETARNNTQVDRAIVAASRFIDNQMHRAFFPWDGIKYIGYPERNANSSWRLWLNQNDLVSVSSLTSGGTTVSASDYFLEPVNSGPPYTSIEIDLSSNAAWNTGDTWQRNVVITGTWGWWDEQEAVGELADNLDASLTDTCTVAWTDMSQVGVGSILKIDSERLVVTDIGYVDTAQNLGSSLTASAAANTVTVSDSTGFYVGELIRIDSEVMRVVDLATSTTIIVKRAWDGSVLAAHSSSADVYGRTGVQLSRAQLGSTLAAHTTSDAVYRYVVPELINHLAIAEAVYLHQSAIGGYGRQEGESVTKPAPASLRSLRDEAYGVYGRKARTYAI